MVCKKTSGVKTSLTNPQPSVRTQRLNTQFVDWAVCNGYLEVVNIHFSAIALLEPAPCQVCQTDKQRFTLLFFAVCRSLDEGTMEREQETSLDWWNDSVWLLFSTNELGLRPVVYLLGFLALAFENSDWVFDEAIGWLEVVVLPAVHISWRVTARCDWCHAVVSHFFCTTMMLQVDPSPLTLLQFLFLRGKRRRPLNVWLPMSYQLRQIGHSHEGEHGHTPKGQVLKAVPSYFPSLQKSKGQEKDWKSSIGQWSNTKAKERGNRSEQRFATAVL